MRNEIEKKEYQEKIKDLKALPGLIEKTLLHDNDIQAISSTFNEAKGSMFLGRGYSYPIALEGALKDLSDDSMALNTTVYEILDVINLLEPDMIEDNKKEGTFNTPS